MNSIAHIVNPFVADPSSDLFSAQPITFESMRHAKQKTEGIARVDLYTAQYKEDEGAVPADFIKTPDLQRSVLDLAGFQKKVKLPLLSDILERLYHASEAEYLIYTNVDIGLYPGFYVEVNNIITQGYDAFIINRRRLPAIYSSPNDLPAIYGQKGKSHPGFDCFVFHRSLFPRLKLDGICIGVPFIEISFSQNLFALSRKFKLFDREFLTFHIGEEVFKKRMPSDYFNYNRQQFWQLVPQLWNDMSLDKFPYANKAWPLCIIHWGLHPCIPIRLVWKLEMNRIKNYFGAKQ